MSSVSVSNCGTINSVGYRLSQGIFQNVIDKSTVILSADSSSVNDYYSNKIIEIISGDGTIYNKIISYDGTTKTAIMKDRYNELPTNVSMYIIHKNSCCLPIQNITDRFYSIKLNDESSTVNGYYNGCYIKLINIKNNKTELNKILTYVGSSKIAHLEYSWNELPQEDNYYIVLGESGNISGSTSLTITCDNLSSSVVPGLCVNIYDGLGKYQTKTISDVTGGVLTINEPWTTIPDSSSKYTIFGGFYGNFENVSNHSNLIYTVSFGEGRIVVVNILYDEVSTSEKIMEINKHQNSHTISLNYRYYKIILIGEGIDIQGNVQVLLYYPHNSILNTLNDKLNDFTDCSINRSVITGKSIDNGQYNNISTDSYGNLNVNINSPKDIVGNISVSEPKVNIEVKFSNTYSWMLGDYFLRGSGALYYSLSQVSAISGTTSGSIARFQSTRRNYYTSGLCCKIRFSCSFSAPAEGCHQLIGYGDSCNGLFFGFKNTSFGIVRRYGGKFEIRTLTLTASSITDGTITITLNNGTYTIPVLSTDTIHNVVRKIYKKDPMVLFNTGNGWSVYENSNLIHYIAETPEARNGTYSFDSGTTGISGSFTQIQAGLSATDEFIPSSYWNIDKLDGILALPDIDFLKGNNFEIEFKWLGYGNMIFKIEDPHTGKYLPVHEIYYCGKNTRPSIDVPHQPLYFEASNGATENNVSLKTGSMASFTQGIERQLYLNRFGTSNIRKQSLTGLINYNIITLRNLPLYMGTTNIIEILGICIGASWKDSSTIGIFKTIVNADIIPGESGITWVPRKYGASIIDVCYDHLQVSGGEENVTICMGTNNNLFQIFHDMEIYMPVGYSLTLAIQCLSNTIDSEYSASIYWGERL